MRRRQQPQRKLRKTLNALPDFRSGISQAGRSSKKQLKDIGRQRGNQSAHPAIGVGFIVVLLGLAWFVHATRVSSVVILKPKTGAFVQLDAVGVITTVDSYLDSSFLNRWFVSEATIRERLVANNADVASVTSVEHSGKELKVLIEPRKRSVVWQAAGKSFSVDTQGIVFDQLSESEELSGAITVIDESGIPVELNQQVASPAFIAEVDELFSFVESSTEVGSIDTFIAPESPREVHFRLKDSPFVVKTLIDASAELSIRGLEDTLAFLKEEGTAVQQAIDLRVEGRAAYR